MSLNNQKIFREFLAVVPPSVQYMVICSQFKEIIEANSFFLIGEEFVPSEIADLITDGTLSLGNASTGLDGVRLKDCPSNVEDTLLYGKEGAVPSEEEILFLDDAFNFWLKSNIVV